jgi:hypothetical protein
MGKLIKADNLTEMKEMDKEDEKHQEEQRYIPVSSLTDDEIAGIRIEHLN